MFGFTPLRRTYAAAVRDLTATRADVRASAARDLGLVGDESPREASDALAPLLHDPEAPVRSAALTALATLEARHLVDSIAARLDDGDATVRQIAAMALSEVGGQSALRHLRNALNHSQPEVRFQAMLGIVELDPAEGLSAAMDALRSTDAWIASEAAAQLGSLLARPLDTRTPSRDAPPPVDDATRATAVGALVEGMDSTNDRVAVCSALALARAGDARAVPVLAHFVLGHRPVQGEDVRELTAEAIAALGTAPVDASGEARATLEGMASRVLPTTRRRLARDALATLNGRAPGATP